MKRDYSSHKHAQYLYHSQKHYTDRSVLRPSSWDLLSCVSTPKEAGLPFHVTLIACCLCKFHPDKGCCQGLSSMNATDNFNAFLCCCPSLNS